MHFLLKRFFELFRNVAKASALAYLFCILFGIPVIGQSKEKIDRKSLVERHKLTITDRNLIGPTQVGNGHFPFGFDITVLQTFSQNANTMSDWGWHKFPEVNGQNPASFKGQESGLVNNGWFGKFHFEMIWWHEAHYALWDRLPLMDKA